MRNTHPLQEKVLPFFGNGIALFESDRPKTVVCVKASSQTKLSFHTIAAMKIIITLLYLFVFAYAAAGADTLSRNGIPSATTNQMIAKRQVSPLSGHEATTDLSTGEVTDAAEEGLRRFLMHTPKTELQVLGVPEMISLKDLSLGRPFRMNQILPDVLEKHKSGESTTEIFSPTTQYYFPVTVGTTTTALLIVDKVNGRWKAVSMGYSELASEIARVKASWPASKGFHVQFAVSLQARRHFFSVPEKSRTNITPIQRTSAAPRKAHDARERKNYEDLNEVSEIIPSLKREVRENIDEMTKRERKMEHSCP